MRLFENDAQLAEALRVLSEAGLIDIVAGNNGKPQFRLSTEIAKGAVKRPSPRQGGLRYRTQLARVRAEYCLRKRDRSQTALSASMKYDIPDILGERIP